MSDKLVIPTGWKLVPVEPTQEMIMAAWEAAPIHPTEHGIDTFAPVCVAMLAAAPSLPIEGTIQ